MSAAKKWCGEIENLEQGFRRLEEEIGKAGDAASA
jgi:hypothetical protein